MINLDIAHRRLYNQLIAQHPFEKPEEVVKWLGAVQAQDYAAAKWALGLRSQGMTEGEVDQALAQGTILRTHVMRPTWHFVSPADIRWMLMLTAPRVNALNAYYYRQLELGDALFQHCNDVLAKALQGGKQLTRSELIARLKLAGVASDNLLRFGYIIMRAELDGIICNAARRGKQFTYALLEERAPHARTLDRDEALAEFARRYFRSHGPATLQDFVWWSGLTTAEARDGLEMVKSQFLQEHIGGNTYWCSPSSPHRDALSQTYAYLLPSYDEYTVGYADRSAVFDESHTPRLDPRSKLLASAMILNGQVVGNWARTLRKDCVIVNMNHFLPLNEAEVSAFVSAANRYGAFLGQPVKVTFAE